MAAARTYWFRAKRYGWGWGLPLTWQGWLVLAAFIVLFALGFLVGEPPRWRWGGGDEA